MHSKLNKSMSIHHMVFWLQHLYHGDPWACKVAKSFSHVWISCLTPGVTFPFGHQCKRAYYGDVEGVCQTQNQTNSWVFTTWFFGCGTFIMVTHELARMPNPFHMYGLVLWRLRSLFDLGISANHTFTATQRESARPKMRPIHGYPPQGFLLAAPLPW